MSLYNMLHGRNYLAEMLIPIIGLDMADIPRYRDTSISENNTQLIILTRTGGGNRESNEEENNLLTEHPNYLSDNDAKFDQTYAEFYFSIPSNWIPDINHIENQTFDKISQEFKDIVKEKCPEHYKAFFEKAAE